jgi:hypothetical protein
VQVWKREGEREGERKGKRKGKREGEMGKRRLKGVGMWLVVVGRRVHLQRVQGRKERSMWETMRRTQRKRVLGRGGWRKVKGSWGRGGPSGWRRQVVRRKRRMPRTLWCVGYRVQGLQGAGCKRV